MAKAKKATDPSAPKTSRSRKQVAPATESPAAAEVTKSVMINAKAEPVEELIRQRAYEIYRQRNGSGGSPEEDWFRAEAEILGKIA